MHILGMVAQWLQLLPHIAWARDSVYAMGRCVWNLHVPAWSLWGSLWVLLDEDDLQTC